MECNVLIGLAALLGFGAGVAISVVIKNIKVKSNRIIQQDISAGGDVVAGNKKKGSSLFHVDLKMKRMGAAIM